MDDLFGAPEDLFVRLQRAKAELEQVTKELTQPGVFARMAAAVFAQHPALLAFRFKAFIPSFNDGDPCSYSRYGSDVLLPLATIGELEFGPEDTEDVNDVAAGWLDDDAGYCEEVAVQLASAAVEELLSALGDDILEKAFGYNVKVTVYRDGRITDDEYYCGH